MIVSGECIITKEQQEAFDKLLENIDKIDLDELTKIDLDKLPILLKKDGDIFDKKTIEHLQSQIK